MAVNSSNKKDSDPDPNDDAMEEVESEPEESSENEESGDEVADHEDTNNRRVYLPNYEKDKDVELECDESAYVLHQSVKTGSPCLSFDIIPDNLGNERANHYPLTVTLVGGTQAEGHQGNNLLVMRLSNMHPNRRPKEDHSEGEDESESEEESETDDKKPVMETATVKHNGAVNRVKVTTLGNNTFAATWSELGKVHLWDLSKPISAVNDNRVMTAYIQNGESPKPVYTFSGHLEEGYALQWSPLDQGVLASGDCKSRVHLWKPIEGGRWHVDQRPYTAHTDSVEDIQWSPNESNVLATCSVDKSIRIWDIRAAPNKACMLTRTDAHDSDVNVISWNKVEPFILSGGDDGKLRVWDIRKFPDSDPICTFKHHTAPITSVEWHPTDSSVFAASSADDQLTQWDLAIERDQDMEKEESEEVLALPAQLLFMHMGQKEIKELHWHNQMPGVVLSTGSTGIDVVRTLSI